MVLTMGILHKMIGSLLPESILMFYLRWFITALFNYLK